jgi:GT2 family glycosyltransferase
VQTLAIAPACLLSRWAPIPIQFRTEGLRPNPLGTTVKVSVIIPVRNEGPALPLTLQTFADLKRHFDLDVIIVDDASDAPVKKLPKGMRLLRHETRQGIARSRNAGARLATGDLLIHTDGHIFFSLDALERLIRACDCRSVVGVRTQLIYDFGQFERQQTESLDGPHYCGWRWTFEPEVSVVPIRTPRSIEPHEVPYVGCACLALTRKLFETLGGFDEELVGCGNFEDADLALCAWARGFQVRMLPTVTCYHYTEPRAGWHRRGRSPLDVPHYDGSLCNALRILRRHLPANWFDKLMLRMACQSPVSWLTLPAAFVAYLLAEESSQPKWEAQRVRSRKWVAEKMQ